MVGDAGNLSYDRACGRGTMGTWEGISEPELPWEFGVELSWELRFFFEI